MKKPLRKQYPGWKEVAKEIREAKKDPRFVEAVEEFIRKTTRNV